MEGSVRKFGERLDGATSPEQRAESVVRRIYASERLGAQDSLVEAISATIAEERRNCARLLDAIKDEYIDWCSVNRSSTVDQMQIVNMLSKAAQSVRARAAAGAPRAALGTAD